MNAILVASGGAIVAAIVSIVTLLLQRKWQKEDKTTDALGELSGKIDNLSAELKSHIEANEVSEAKQARARILRFADECRRNELHSKEFFDSVLDDVDLYEWFSNGHPDFPNNKTVASTKIIKDLYDKCLRENKFI